MGCDSYGNPNDLDLKLIIPQSEPCEHIVKLKFFDNEVTLQSEVMFGIT